MTLCALHALVLIAQAALPDILGIPPMPLDLHWACLSGPGSRTLFTLLSPSQGSGSVHSDLHLLNVQENTVRGDEWWWKGTSVLPLLCFLYVDLSGEDQGCFVFKVGGPCFDQIM